MAVRVKVCGITNVSDARSAVRCGVDALGFVFANSPRKVSPERARAIVAAIPPFVCPVALFVDAESDYIREVCDFCGISTVQLHGNEPSSLLPALHPLKIIKAIRVKQRSDVSTVERYMCDAYLLDTHVQGKQGGTGQTFNWEWAAKAKRHGPLILAGGLTPENVGEAIRVTKPYAVDVSSGVELAPGEKSGKLIEAFVRATQETGR